MNFLYSDDPIIACSTNNTINSGIAVLRLSGLRSIIDLQIFFELNLSKIESRYAYFTKLIFKNVVYDEVILTYFKSPKSYNGENILEISIHGNLVNIENIINLFCTEANFRRAYPGEFTYRALKNKKLSLSQVEGLDLLLNASSTFALKQGLSVLNGKLQETYKNLYQSFLAHKSAIELSIDFLDDVGTEAADKLFADTLLEISSAVEKLKSHIDNAGTNLINPEVTLVGLPNAGKSTFFNLLLNDERAIVSSIAGTTRDYLSENIKLKENYYKLIDTAGIRETFDEIELEGIKRSLKLARNSFFKILVINPYNFNLSFFKLVEDISFDLIVFSHSQLENYSSQLMAFFKSVSGFSLFKNLQFGPIEPVISGPIEPMENVLICDLLLHSREVFKHVENIVNNKYLSKISSEPILIERHREQINIIYKLLSDYNSLSCSEKDISILSSEFNTIGHCISELIGIVSPDDVLHNIFSNFCIGK